MSGVALYCMAGSRSALLYGALLLYDTTKLATAVANLILQKFKPLFPISRIGVLPRVFSS